MGGTASIDELAAVLVESPGAWIRLGTAPLDQLRVFEVTLGALPPFWRELEWTYSSACLAAFSESGAAVAQWLKAREIKTRGFDVALTDLGSNAMTDRRRSEEERAGHQRLDWPSDEWVVSSNRGNAFSDDMIAIGDTPSFASFDWAAANLLGLPDTSPNWTIGSPDLLVRRQDLTARIANVLVDRMTVDVVVEGAGLAGAVLELAGDLPGESRTLSDGTRQEVRFGIPDGLPSGAWLVVRRDGKWIDRRTWHMTAAITVRPASSMASSTTPSRVARSLAKARPARSTRV